MKNRKFKNIAIISAFNNKIAADKKRQLIKKYDLIDISNDPLKIKDIDLVIVLGGDGLMLHLLHKYENKNINIYGINCGTVGFLTNSSKEKDLIRVIENSQITVLHPLRMDVETIDNKKYSSIAINEVALLRQTNQAAKIKIKINNKERLPSALIGDGILLSTPAGSTAYNMSLRGPIIPLGSKMLALTPISPFRPRNWHGAILPCSVEVKLDIVDPENRQVSATADFIEFRNVKTVTIREDKDISFNLLFDSNHSLEERIIREQFASYQD